MAILDDVLRATQAELRQRLAARPLADLRRMVRDAPPVRSLRSAIARRFTIIGEIKDRSPSAGRMEPANVAKAIDVYESTPAISAISVLTQEKYFGGSVERLRRIRESTKKPILRKDFIVDEYQVWEARAFGADAVLLMATLFYPDKKHMLSSLFELATSLGLEVLVEIGMGDAGTRELSSIVPPQATIWGANSRSFHGSPLKVRLRTGRLVGRDLTVDRQRHAEIRRLIPPGKIAVAESGIQEPKHLEPLVTLGYHAALIGTAFLKGREPIRDIVRAFSDKADELGMDRGRLSREDSRVGVVD